MEKGDTLRSPELLTEKGKLMEFDIVIANAPSLLRTGAMKKPNMIPIDVSDLVSLQKDMEIMRLYSI